MITSNNFKKVLLALGFSQNKNGQLFEKHFFTQNCDLKVDFSTEKLIYPKQIIGHDRNTAFKKSNGQENNENFVVFECVHRLLEKGYRPEHIQLEKQWTLGHTTKGGRGDIIVYDQNNKNVLCIIECKTFGKEYNTERDNTCNDGSQLFSYWQQEASTKWLALYASDFSHLGLSYNCEVINCSDDPNIISIANTNKHILLYRDAHSKDIRYETWKKTYKCKWYSDLIFSNNTVAYNIGVKPIKKGDLITIDNDSKKKIIDNFEEILRHNNVSDKENAFNRLIALFICKLVDESLKNDNEVVEFQYQQGTDTYESLQDRLQRLYQKGMSDFMGEKIEYVANDFASKFLASYSGSNRKNAVQQLEKTIRILKFYSNNDFAFKEVHNEELFLQNGKILVEIVQLFEKFRLVYSYKLQFLGDLFEQLLNKGFKQNEGQFFTPVPIARFVWDSIPIERILNKKNNSNYPKIIDFACGSGHFLTEAIECIDDYYNQIGFGHLVKDNAWTRDYIFGIEKDYRLARVSKVSMFMNGAGNSNIIFGDGLDNYPHKNIDNSSFDVLVANPPYSVKAFKQHLDLKSNNNLRILQYITKEGGEIETLFVERIAQLLKNRGIAAVILPSSMLSNGDSAYIEARNEFLMHFHIRAICCMGQKTFGATSKTTVIMFLEKRDEIPSSSQLAKDRVFSIFNQTASDKWGDCELLDEYITHLNIPPKDYLSFLKAKNKTECGNLFDKSPYFEEYVHTYSQNSNGYNNFIDYVKDIEREKMFVFSLVFKENDVLIINSPEDTDKQKDFLGYKWTNGNIQPVSGKSISGGKMFDSKNRHSNDVLADVVKNSFDGKKIIPASGNLKDLYYYKSLKDMLDFETNPFDNTIYTHRFKFNVNNPKYSLVKLRNIAYVSSGDSAPQGTTMFAGGTFPFFRTNDVGSVKISKSCIKTKDKLNKFGINKLHLWKKGTILFPKSGASTYLDHRVVMGCDGYVASHLATISSKKNINNEYLFYVLVLVKAKGVKPISDYPSLNCDDLNNLRIPFPGTISAPDFSEQMRIVGQCDIVYNKFMTSKVTPDTFRSNIESIFRNAGITCGIQ